MIHLVAQTNTLHIKMFSDVPKIPSNSSIDKWESILSNLTIIFRMILANNWALFMIIKTRAQISKHHLLNQRENKIMGFRFG